MKTIPTAEEYFRDLDTLKWITKDNLDFANQYRKHCLTLELEALRSELKEKANTVIDFQGNETNLVTINVFAIDAVINNRLNELKGET